MALYPTTSGNNLGSRNKICNHYLLISFSSEKFYRYQITYIQGEKDPLIKNINYDGDDNEFGVVSRSTSVEPSHKTIYREVMLVVLPVFR